jgi:hypothetical protein
MGAFMTPPDFSFRSHKESCSGYLWARCERGQANSNTSRSWLIGTGIAFQITECLKLNA